MLDAVASASDACEARFTKTAPPAATTTTASAVTMPIFAFLVPGFDAVRSQEAAVPAPLEAGGASLAPADGGAMEMEPCEMPAERMTPAMRSMDAFACFGAKGMRATENSPTFW